MSNTPTLARRTLGSKLRRLREAAEVHINDAAAHVGVDRTTVQRWEHGKTAPKAGAIRALGALFGAAPAEVSRLTTLAAQSAERGIWEGAKVPPRLRALYESEGGAHRIRSVELDYIPGLLQTPEYLRAAQAAQVPLSPEDAKAVQQAYQQRQTVIFGNRARPRMEFIFGQSALAYLDALPDVREGQVRRLREADAMRGVEIRVITGLHAAMDGAFTIIESEPELADPFVFLESADGCRYVEARDVVSEYEASFEAVRRQSIPLEEYLT